MPFAGDSDLVLENREEKNDEEEKQAEREKKEEGRKGEGEGEKYSNCFIT